MAIREATEADLDALLPLMRAYCDFYESSPGDDGLLQMARSSIAAPEDEAFLLVSTDGDGRVVGFAHNQWKWSSLRGRRIVFLDDLFVAESARGGGHADALIEATAAVGRRHGAAAVNHRAQAVYNRIGGRAEMFLEYELDLRADERG